MAKKRKKGRFEIRDERIPKLFGILCLFIAAYLLIAFTSYLFTWHIDQNLVLRFSWGLLGQTELEMANWLGRLGAIISNMFFYWGFGVPSYIFVILLVFLGMNLIRQTPLKVFWEQVRNGLILVLVLSVLFEFLFASSFPWGGAFGDAINTWLQSFVGTAGMLVLFVTVLALLAVWSFNPNFNEMTFETAQKDVKLFFHEKFYGRRPVRKSRPNPAVKEAALKPRSAKELAQPKKPKEGQIAMELREKTAKPKALQIGEGELEIEIQEEEPPVVIDETTPLPTPPKPITGSQQIDNQEPYDPTLDLSNYEKPILGLLNDYNDQKHQIDREELELKKDKIIETLLQFKIEVTNIKATVGPTVTLFKVRPAPGVRISKIKNLEDDIALRLSALGIRIIAPIPGEGVIGIEIPNEKKQVVSLKEVLASDSFKHSKMQLPIAFGKTIANKVFVADLAKMPHLLIAGATGQGKSVGINVVIMSILYRMHPSQVKLVLVDPKKVELYPYSKLDHHFLSFLPGSPEPITTETSKVVHTLNSLCIEMDQRYDLLKKAAARNIREYNEKFVARRLNPNNGHRFLPFIVLVIDEFADLIMTAGKEVELPIGRLAQLARAVGIHLIIATQRPSVNIITGIIKANFPARIAYKVTAKVDSRTILDGGGADQLIGRGDMLLSINGEMVRLQCAFVDTPEVEKVIDYIGNQPRYPEPHFLPEFHGDDSTHSGGGFNISEVDSKFEEAARLVVQNQHGSTSMIQRRLKLGYNRAGRIMDQMEALGIVGPSEGSKPREVLIYDELELERYLQDLKSKKK